MYVLRTLHLKAAGSSVGTLLVCCTFDRLLPWKSQHPACQAMGSLSDLSRAPILASWTTPLSGSDNDTCRSHLLILLTKIEALRMAVVPCC